MPLFPLREERLPRPQPPARERHAVPAEMPTALTRPSSHISPVHDTCHRPVAITCLFDYTLRSWPVQERMCYYRHSIGHSRPSTFSLQPSAFSLQPSAFSLQPSNTHPACGTSDHGSASCRGRSASAPRPPGRCGAWRCGSRRCPFSRCSGRTAPRGR
jgi:hypothetical protein